MAIRDTMTPEKETAVGHCKRDETDVYIGRGPNGRDMTETAIGERGWLGNPYSVELWGREGCVENFRADFEQRLEWDRGFRDAVSQLSGKTLGCWCRSVDEDEPACHGDVIAEHADRLVTEGVAQYRPKELP